MGEGLIASLAAKLEAGRTSGAALGKATAGLRPHSWLPGIQRLGSCVAINFIGLSRHNRACRWD